jgi:hypothetical protein
LVAGSPGIGSQVDAAEPSRDLVWRWVDAVNRRDVEALLGMADEDIICRPLRIAGVRGIYAGHAGLRQWISILRAEGSDYEVRCDEIRTLGNGLVAAFGVLLHDGCATAPWALVASVHNDKLTHMESYFSVETTLARMGLLGQEPSSL